MTGAQMRQPADTLSADVEAALFQASQDCVKLLSLDGRLLAMNANGICLMEIDDFEALKGGVWSTLWPDEHQDLVDASVASASGGSVARFSADCATAKGVMKSWEVIVSPVFDATGAICQIVSVSQEVTAKRRLAADNELLTQELAHRIANMFAVVDGVIALSARNDANAQPFADDLRRRLRDLGRATAYVSPLYPAGDRPESAATVAGLLRLLLEPYAATSVGQGQRIVVTGDDVVVGPRGTTGLALAANELATNSLKYGALSEPEGTLAITLTREGDVLRLAWSEQGGPPVTEPTTPKGGGFGRTLLENTIVRQLGGALRHVWRPEGLAVEISLPLAALAD